MAIDEVKDPGTQQETPERAQAKELEAAPQEEPPTLDVSTHPAQEVKKSEPEPVQELTVASVSRDGLLEGLDPSTPAQEIFGTEGFSGIGGTSPDKIREAGKSQVIALASQNPALAEQPLGPGDLLQRQFHFTPLATSRSAFANKAFDNASPAAHAIVEQKTIDALFENPASQSASPARRFLGVAPRLGETLASHDPDLATVRQLALSQMPSHFSRWDKDHFPSAGHTQDKTPIDREVKRLAATTMSAFLESGEGTTIATRGRMKPTLSRNQVESVWNSDSGDRYRQRKTEISNDLAA